MRRGLAELIDHKLNKQGQTQPRKRSPPNIGRALGYFLLVAAVGYLINEYASPPVHLKSIPYSEFLRELEAGRVDHSWLELSPAKQTYRSSLLMVPNSSKCLLDSALLACALYLSKQKWLQFRTSD